MCNIRWMIKGDAGKTVLKLNIISNKMYSTVAGVDGGVQFVHRTRIHFRIHTSILVCLKHEQQYPWTGKPSQRRGIEFAAAKDDITVLFHDAGLNKWVENRRKQPKTTEKNTSSPVRAEFVSHFYYRLFLPQLNTLDLVCLASCLISLVRSVYSR